MRLSATVLLVSLVLLLSSSAVPAQTFGGKKRAPKPHEYGNVVINNFSEKKNMAPVVFAHWLHRAQYTCRLCHVDLGFAMEPGGTGITEDDNQNGLYCGACHNGERAFAAREKGRLAAGRDNCDRCHSHGKDVKPEKDFYSFVKKFPKARFGNKVDWLKAEAKEFIKLEDHLEGITIKRKALKVPLDIQIEAKVIGMPDILFSHQKHAVWNGCELCHPDIFGVKKGATKYEMQDIFDGKFCGACHGKVSFTTMDCQLCHTGEVY